MTQTSPSSTDWSGPGTRQVRSRRRDPLSLERILDVALAIVDGEGTEAVTMRRVGSELSTGASSLYAYVKDRDSLLRAVLDRLTSELPAPPRSGEWKADLRSAMVGLRSMLAAHGDIAIMLFAQIPSSDKSFEGLEAMLELLIGGGVPPRVAIMGLERLQMYTVADVYESWRFRQLGVGEVQAKMTVEDLVARLPEGRLPRVRDNVGLLLTQSEQERFEMGLDMLINGIAAAAVCPAD